MKLYIVIINPVHPFTPDISLPFHNVLIVLPHPVPQEGVRISVVCYVTNEGEEILRPDFGFVHGIVQEPGEEESFSYVMAVFFTIICLAVCLQPSGWNS